ncbi:MAG: hypothetical protein RR837_11495 [Bacteroidales bacterium]
MRNTVLLRTKLFLMGLFISVSLSAQVTDYYEYTFEKAEWKKSGIVILNNISWDAQGDNDNSWISDQTYGQQFGTGTNPVRELSITTSGFDKTIKKITITTKGANDISATLEVLVGGKSFGEVQNLTSKLISYTFPGSAQGEVVLKWSQPISSKAIYLKKISVESVDETKVAAPQLTPAGGTAEAPLLIEYGTPIHLSSKTPDALFYDEDGAEIKSPVLITIPRQRIKVQAVLAGMDSSAWTEAWYSPRLAAPTIVLNEFSGRDSVIIRANPVATIYYAIADGEYQQGHSPVRFPITHDMEVRAYARFDTLVSEETRINFSDITPQLYEVWFKESFDRSCGLGGNDDQWTKGYTSVNPKDYPEWTFGDKTYNAYHCLRLGTTEVGGSITTPALNVTGDFILAFRAGLWKGIPAKDFKVTVSDPKQSTSVTIQSESFTTFRVPLENLNSQSKITLSCVDRFYIDDIMLLKAVGESVDPQREIVIFNATPRNLYRFFMEYPDSGPLNLAYAELSSLATITLPQPANRLIYSRASHNLAANVVVYDSCAHFRLTDLLPVAITTPFHADTVSYARSAYRDGNWESLMLPFNLSKSRMPESYHFAKFSELSPDNTLVKFIPADTLAAHTPYLMRYASSPTDTKETVLFSTTDASITPPLPQADFTGVYHRTGTSGKYILGMKDNKVIFGRGGSASYVSPFRAYLDLELPAESGPLRIVHQSDQTTGLQNSDLSKSWSWHSSRKGTLILTTPVAAHFLFTTIDGRIIRSLPLAPGTHRIDHLPSGVVIINKRKTVVL